MGTEALLSLLEELSSNSNSLPSILEQVEIHIIPRLNHDGCATTEYGSCVGEQGSLNKHDANLMELERGQSKGMAFGLKEGGIWMKIDIGIGKVGATVACHV